MKPSRLLLLFAACSALASCSANARRLPCRAIVSGCGVPPIEFARDSTQLSPNNQARLAAAFACLSTKRLVLVACRADDQPAEPAELARRRADAVLHMLTNLGMSNDLVVADFACDSGRSVSLRVWQ